MFKILIVEDDTDLNQLFYRTLQRNGYVPFSVADALEALNFLHTESVDLIITDVMMPGMNGFEFVRQLREARMMITVQALLRRAKSVSERKLTFGGTELHYDNWMVTDSQGSQTLPQKEFQLLYKLLSYPGQIFTRQQILDDIWGVDGYVDSHTLDVHISRLRERFKKNEDFEIVTIRGLGYRAVKR